MTEASRIAVRRVELWIVIVALVMMLVGYVYLAIRGETAAQGIRDQLADEREKIIEELRAERERSVEEIVALIRSNKALADKSSAEAKVDLKAVQKEVAKTKKEVTTIIEKAPVVEPTPTSKKGWW